MFCGDSGSVIASCRLDCESESFLKTAKTYFREQKLSFGNSYRPFHPGQLRVSCPFEYTFDIGSIDIDFAVVYQLHTR